jgi:hypothetical protein
LKEQGRAADYHFKNRSGSDGIEDFRLMILDCKRRAAAKKTFLAGLRDRWLKTTRNKNRKKRKKDI